MAPCVTSGSPHPTTSEKSSWSLLQARFYLLSLVLITVHLDSAPLSFYLPHQRGLELRTLKSRTEDVTFFASQGQQGVRSRLCSCLLLSPASFCKPTFSPSAPRGGKCCPSLGPPHLPAQVPNTSSWASPCLCSPPLRHYECTLQLDAF